MIVILRNLRCSWLCVYLFLPMVVCGQIMDTSTKVDTLSMAERISLRTNAVDWLLLVPNIGVEFDVRNTNWNRWSAGINLRYNWQSRHTFKPGIVYNVFEARGEVRYYYRIREFDGQFIEPKEHAWERMLSPRRAASKHPMTTYYRGAFVAYNDFSLKFGREGRQGHALIGGLLLGIIRPMYTFASGNTLDFELGAAVGVAFAKYDTYRHEPQDDCYPIVARQQTAVMPVINDLRAGFVYRFGQFPITRKYRWRYDVDTAYQNRIVNAITEKRRLAKEKAISDSVDALVRKLFWQQYDSIAKINETLNAARREEEKRNAAEQKIKDDELKKQNAQVAADKKAAEKAAREEEKRRQKEEKEAAKKAKKEGKPAEPETEETKHEE